MDELRHRISIKSIAVMLAMILLSGVTTAQTYSVRVTFRTNLRASYSLQATILDVALAGATLNVTGSHESWLRINRNSREVWLADWVPMTRLDSPQTVSSDINNCCFIDRQCASNDDWVNGYWAYQNNQCGAPATTTATDSTQPTGTTSATVNNCCQTGWLCHSEHDWQTGYMAFHTNQCLHYGIEIEGPESFATQLHSALDLLRDHAPDWYGYVISGLTKVRYDPNASRSAVYAHSGAWHVPPSRVEIWGDMVVIIGGLAHEACHVHRHRAGQESGGLVGERDCLEKQIAAAKAVYPTGREWYIGWGANLLANIENPEFQWWH